MLSPQGDWSDYAVHCDLDCWLGGQVRTPPPIVYVGLSRNLSYHLYPTMRGEPPAEAGYTRVAIPNTLVYWPAAQGRVKSNGTEIVFPAPTGRWGRLRSWLIADGPTIEAKILASGTVTVETVVNAGSTPVRFAVGALVFAR